MNYCPSCGYELRSEARFCPGCGKNLRPEASPVLDTKHYNQKRNTILRITLGLGVLILVGYLMTNITAIRKLVFSPDEVLEVASGTYSYPSNTTIGTIDVINANGHLMGESSAGTFYFDLTPTGKNALEGKVTLKGVESQHRAIYDQEKQRLTFSWDLTPSTWYIEKIK
jgi:hypothetical protein